MDKIKDILLAIFFVIELRDVPKSEIFIGHDIIHNLDINQIIEIDENGEELAVYEI